MKDIPEFESKDYQESLKGLSVSIPDHIADEIARFTNRRLRDWSITLPDLYGRKDDVDGWQLFEVKGDMDTHVCRAFGFEEIK